MNRFSIYLIILSIALMSNPLISSGISNDIPQKNIDEARIIAAEKGKVLFVYFYASWCKPCQWMDQVTFKNIDVQKSLENNFIRVQVNIDDIEGYELKKMYDIKYLPTMIMFNSGGQMIDRIEETLTPAKMNALLNKHNTLQNKSIIQHDFNKAPGAEHLLTFESESMRNTAEEYSKHFQQKQVNKVYRVQVGVFSRYHSAEMFVKSLSEITDAPVTVVNEYQNDDPTFKVRVGQFDSYEAAEAFKIALFTDFKLEGSVI
ncbi:MAG: thioredoxin family protein [Saprospiraceae bacterium]